jgi:hypothetical protein
MVNELWQGWISGLFCTLPAPWMNSLTKMVTMLGSGMAGGIWACLVYLALSRVKKHSAV